MKKNIEDYLHLYKGLPCILKGGQKEFTGCYIFEPTGTECVVGYSGMTGIPEVHDSKNVIPLLLTMNSLINLSEERRIELEDIFGAFAGYAFIKCLITKKDIPGGGWNLAKVNAAVNLLRKWGYDCDELIDAGLAQDIELVLPKVNS